MGLGPVAPTFAALVQRYAQSHFGHTTANRFIALSGDAELDEGNIWEALIEEELQRLPNLLWIVDLNRQSLDRITPGVRAAKLKSSSRIASGTCSRQSTDTICNAPLRNPAARRCASALTT